VGLYRRPESYTPYPYLPRPAIRFGVTKPHFRDPKYQTRDGGITRVPNPFPYKGFPYLGHPRLRYVSINHMWWRMNRLGQTWVMPPEGYSSRGLPLPTPSGLLKRRRQRHSRRQRTTAMAYFRFRNQPR
jgi:hypothetical protein